MNPNGKDSPEAFTSALTPFDKFNPYHQEAAKSVLESIIKKVADVHGASFNKSGLRRNMMALNAGDITIAFYRAKWELCNPKEVCIGGAISWGTYGIDQRGQARRGLHTEDVSMFMDKVRELIRLCPDGKGFPDEGLAGAFERLTIQKLRSQKDIHFKYGEVSPDNIKMRRPLEKNGGIFGNEGESAVLEFLRFPNNLMDRLPMPVEVDHMDRASTPSNFVTRLSDGIHDIRFVATKGQATAAGKARVDLRPWHNGHLPNPDILDCVLASSLLAIKRKAEKLKWGNPSGSIISSPSIPLQALRPEVFAALCNACGNDLTSSPDIRPITVDRPMPEAHAFVFNDGPMLNALMALGAKPRLFGGKCMMPGVNNFGVPLNLVM